MTKTAISEGVASMLTYINAATLSGCEEDVEPLLAMMRPTEDKTEMGQIYEETMGYNPITYFDRKYLSKKIKIISKEAPSDVRGELLDREDEIIDIVMTHKENLDDDYLKMILVSAIESTLGWKAKENVDFAKLLDDELGDGGFEIMSDESFDDEESDMGDDDEPLVGEDD